MNVGSGDAATQAGLDYYSRPTQRPVLCVHWHAEMGSSNDGAIRLAREGAPAGTVVWAEVQTAARGRSGRAWSTGPGNASFTLIVRPSLPIPLAGRLAVSAGQGAAHALRTLTGLDVKTKWPNDLYLDGRKLGGILVESRAAPGGSLEWAVVGIGINVAWAPQVEPPGQPAISLADARCLQTVDSVVQVISAAVLSASRAAQSRAGWDAIVEQWTRTDLALEPLRVHDNETDYDARGISLAANGALVVETADGLREVSAGEVSIRPASF